MKLKVKICGMKFPDNIAEVGELEPDYLGFIFHPSSPRNCEEGGKRLLNTIGGKTMPVMVSVNMPEERLLTIISEWGFHVVQLHGCETPELCQRLRDQGLIVWKAIPIGDATPDSAFEFTEKYNGCVDMFLFDTATKNHGGSGLKFDWKLLDSYDGDIPFMLSGGISPQDTEKILQLNHPKLSGIDLNSRFELEPGLKDTSLLSKFINSISKI